MKKILTPIIICLLFACSKTGSGNSDSSTSYSGTLIIGPTVRNISDYSNRSKTPGALYDINGKPSSSVPACSAKNDAPNFIGYTVTMIDSRPDTLSRFQFNIPSYSSFSDYRTTVYIEIGGNAVQAVADISFNMTKLQDGSFAMQGKALVSAGDTVNFSFNASFKNMPSL